MFPPYSNDYNRVTNWELTNTKDFSNWDINFDDDSDLDIHSNNAFDWETNPTFNVKVGLTDVKAEKTEYHNNSDDGCSDRGKKSRRDMKEIGARRKRNKESFDFLLNSSNRDFEESDCGSHFDQHYKDNNNLYNGENQNFIIDDLSLLSLPEPTDEELVNVVCKVLQRMFRLQSSPVPQSFYVTRWNSDCFSLGSYSYFVSFKSKTGFVLVNFKIVNF